MKPIIILAFIVILTGCTKDVPCADSDVQMAFIGFTKPELDTIVLRKFQPDDNYHHLIDTVSIFYDTSMFFRSNDTTYFFSNPLIWRIQAGNDWQVFIPARTKTVLISAIVTEQRTTKCGTVGEPLMCDCMNKIYSLRKDNTFIDMSNLNPYRVYIDR